ncbi:7,8-dihydro-8-oxoguanine triphosphatase [Lamellibrachia satsuma]|nr:7,8-dihydro-8-oxoguanine triphosphatase [Lamellibrachia satsuma]
MYQRRGARRPSKRTAPCQQISVSHSCVSRLAQQNGRPLIGNKLSTMVDNTASLQIAVFRATKCLSRAWPVVRSLLTIATVVLLKAAVSVYVFRCPCKNTSDTDLTIFSKLPSNTVYSALFIGVPPFLLWIYGISVQSIPWQSVSGWRVQPKCRHPCRTCFSIWRALVTSSLAPITWLILVFLDVRYVECMLARKPSECTSGAASVEELNELQNIRIWSHIITCCAAGGAILLYFIGSLCWHCCSSTPHYQAMYAESFRQTEEQAFEMAIHESLDERMRTRWKALFAQGNRYDWSAVSGMPPAAASVDGERVTYSNFHEWTEADTGRLEPVQVALPQYRSSSSRKGSKRREGPPRAMPSPPPGYDSGNHGKDIVDPPGYPFSSNKGHVAMTPATKLPPLNTREVKKMSKKPKKNQIMVTNKLLTLAFVKTPTQILLGYKKRGFGLGRWNGFGGKVEVGETIEDAAKRELMEECGLVADVLHKIGILMFEFVGDPQLMEVHVFTTSQWKGTVKESDEMRPEWYHVDNIPYKNMWTDDQFWFPYMLNARPFYGYFKFEGMHKIVYQRLDTVRDLDVVEIPQRPIQPAC